MEHKYLDNLKRTRTATILLAVASAVLAVVALFLLERKGEVAAVLLGISALCAIVLAALVMHYVRHNNGGKRTLPASHALHAYAVHSIFLIALLFMGKPGTFSYGFVHALLDGGLTALLLLMAGCLFRKCTPVWLAAVAGFAASVLSLLDIGIAVNLILIAAALALLIGSLRHFKNNGGVAFCALLMALVVLITAVLALLTQQAGWWHTLMHVDVQIAGLFLGAFALAFFSAAAGTAAKSSASGGKAPAKIADTEEEDNTVFNRDKWIIKQYQHLSPAELMDAPVDTLYGVSKGDADLLGESFGIKTIGDLSRNKFFQWAEEIVDASEGRASAAASPAAKSAKKASAKTADTEEENNTVFDRDKWIIKQYQHLSLAELMDAPVDALYGVSKEDADLLRESFGIKTIGDLSRNKFFQWTEEIVDEAQR